MIKTRDYIWTPWQDRIPAHIPEIVQYNASMTRRLSQDSGQKPLILKRSEKTAAAHHRDCLLLGMSAGTWLWQREILLGNRHPWLYGYTMTLPSTRSRTLWDLHHIGTKPLGEKLFTTSGVQRVLFEVGMIHPDHYLWRQVKAMHDDISDSLWGRCSLFNYQGNALLLYEILLPNCPGLENNE